MPMLGPNEIGFGLQWNIGYRYPHNVTWKLHTILFKFFILLLYKVTIIFFMGVVRTSIS